MDDPLPHLFTTLWFHPSALLDPVVLGSLLGMAALLFLSALVAAAEVSYFSLEPSHLEALANSQERRDRLVTELWGRQKRLIATIVIAHNLVNIGVVVLSETVSKPLLAGIASPPVEFMQWFVSQHPDTYFRNEYDEEGMYFEGVNENSKKDGFVDECFSKEQEDD